MSPELLELCHLEILSGVLQWEINLILQLSNNSRYFFYYCSLYNREAWHGLGQMSKEEAMESYVSELKKVIMLC